MALFVWRCESCGAVTRKILPTRPSLDRCERVVSVKVNDSLVGSGPCWGKQGFITNTNSQTMEVIDNGLMAKVLERPADVEQKMHERNTLADKEMQDEPIV